MRKVVLAVLVATLIASTLQRGAAPARAAVGDNAVYLALGTSLAVGYQPGRGETSEGYVDELSRILREQVPGLSVENLGCPGETARSMVTGERSLCGYAAGSQLDAAVSFLEAHPGDVAFITVEVGANDLLERCVGAGGLILRSCAGDIRPRLEQRISHIVDALATGAGTDVPIVGMTYYNPFLGLWDLVPNGHELARADQRAWSVLNAALASAYAAAGAAVADVAATFRIDDFTHTVVVPGFGRTPVNVALACRWTWFCSRRFFTDPHTNATGYRRIAGTFYRALRALLPS
jgi:lysophospholipase L1-like esterase